MYHRLPAAEEEQYERQKKRDIDREEFPMRLDMHCEPHEECAARYAAHVDDPRIPAAVYRLAPVTGRVKHPEGDDLEDEYGRKAGVHRY